MQKKSFIPVLVVICQLFVCNLSILAQAGVPRSPRRRAFRRSGCTIE